MKLSTIKTESEYTFALAQVDALMDSKLGSKEELELERISLLLEEYEAKNYPIGPLVTL